jgi:hypothetical protein
MYYSFAGLVPAAPGLVPGKSLCRHLQLLSGEMLQLSECVFVGFHFSGEPRFFLVISNCVPNSAKQHFNSVAFLLFKESFQGRPDRRIVQRFEEKLRFTKS